MQRYAGQGSDQFNESMGHMEDLGLDEDEEAQIESVAMQSQKDIRKWFIGLAVVLLAAISIGIGVSVATASAQAALVSSAVDTAAGALSNANTNNENSGGITGVVTNGGTGSDNDTAGITSSAVAGDVGFNAAKETANAQAQEEAATEAPTEITVHVHSRLEVGFTDAQGNPTPHNLTTSQVDWMLNQTQHFFCNEVFPKELDNYANLKDCYLLLPEFVNEMQTLWFNLAAQFDWDYNPDMPTDIAIPNEETLFNDVANAMSAADLEGAFRYQFEHEAAKELGENDVFGTIGSTKVVHVDDQGEWPEDDVVTPPTSTILTGSANGEITRAPGFSGETMEQAMTMVQQPASGEAASVPGAEEKETTEESAAVTTAPGAEATEVAVAETATEEPEEATLAPTHQPVEKTTQEIKVEGLLDFKMIQGLVGRLPSKVDEGYLLEKAFEFYSMVLPKLVPNLHSVDIEFIGSTLEKGKHGNNDVQWEFNTVFYFEEDAPRPLPTQLDLATILQDNVDYGDMLQVYVWQNEETLFFKTQSVDYDHPYHSLDVASTTGPDTMTLDSTMQYAFWENAQLADPSKDLTNQLMELTREYYEAELKLVLKHYFVNVTYFKHVSNTFEPNKQEPLTVEFVMTLKLDPTKATKQNVDAGLLSLDGMAEFLSNGLDYQNYVENYCWKLKGSMFFRAKGVKYSNKQTAQARNLRRHLEEYERLFG